MGHMVGQKSFNLFQAIESSQASSTRTAPPPCPPPEPTEWLDVEMAPGPLGIAYEGYRVTEVRPGGQSERAGVTVGMRIYQIAGTRMPDDGFAIKERLVRLKNSDTPFTVRFIEP